MLFSYSYGRMGQQKKPYVGLFAAHLIMQEDYKRDAHMGQSPKDI